MITSFSGKLLMLLIAVLGILSFGIVGFFGMVLAMLVIDRVGWIGRVYERTPRAIVIAVWVGGWALISLFAASTVTGNQFDALAVGTVFFFSSLLGMVVSGLYLMYKFGPTQ